MRVKVVASPLGVSRPLGGIEATTDDRRVGRQSFVPLVGFLAGRDPIQCRLIPGQDFQHFIEHQIKDIVPQASQLAGAESKGTGQPTIPHVLRTGLFAQSPAPRALGYPAAHGLCLAWILRHESSPGSIERLPLPGQQCLSIDRRITELRQLPVEPIRLFCRTGDRDLELLRSPVTVLGQIRLALHFTLRHFLPARQRVPGSAAARLRRSDWRSTDWHPPARPALSGRGAARRYSRPRGLQCPTPSRPLA